MRHGPDHVRRRPVLHQPVVHPRDQRERLRVGQELGRRDERPHRRRPVAALPGEPVRPGEHRVFAEPPAPVAHIEDHGVPEHPVERFVGRDAERRFADDHAEFAFPIDAVAPRRDPVFLAGADDSRTRRLGEEVRRVPAGNDAPRHIHLGGVHPVVRRRGQQVGRVEQRRGEPVRLDAEPQPAHPSGEVVGDPVEPRLGVRPGGDDLEQVVREQRVAASGLAQEERFGGQEVEDLPFDHDGRARVAVPGVRGAVGGHLPGRLRRRRDRRRRHVPARPAAAGGEDAGPGEAERGRRRDRRGREAGPVFPAARPAPAPRSRRASGHAA